MSATAAAMAKLPSALKKTKHNIATIIDAGSNSCGSFPGWVVWGKSQAMILRIKKRNAGAVLIAVTVSTGRAAFLANDCRVLMSERQGQRRPTPVKS